MPEQSTESAQQPQTAIELYQSNGLIVVSEAIKDNGTKTTSVTVAKAKAFAAAFNVGDVKLSREALALKRDECSQALKTLAVMRVGGLAQNAAVIGKGIRTTIKKNGNVTHVLTFEEQKGKTSSEEACARFLGMTVEQIRELRKTNLSKTATVNVQATVEKSTEAAV